MLELRDVSRSAGRETLLIHVSLTFTREAPTAVLGLSGAGREALLRLLAGADKPQAGFVKLDGKDIGQMRKEKGLIVRVSAHGFPRSGQRVSKLIGAEAAARVRLAGRMDASVSELDLDQRLRLAIARARAERPEVMLLDALGAGLERDVRDRFVADLRTMLADTGAVVVLVTDSADAALGLGGGIQSVGSGRHLLGLEPHIYPGLGFQFVVPPGKPMRANPVGIPGVWEGPMPPFVASMKEAVTRLVDSKFGPNGTFRKPHEQTWVRPGSAQQVPEHSARAVDATIAFTEYVLATYGRFPAHADACKSVVACQTHHLDEDFYATFYPDSALPDAHREHMHAWHSH